MQNIFRIKRKKDQASFDVRFFHRVEYEVINISNNFFFFLQYVVFSMIFK